MLITPGSILNLVIHFDSMEEKHAQGSTDQPGCRKGRNVKEQPFQGCDLVSKAMGRTHLRGWQGHCGPFLKTHTTLITKGLKSLEKHILIFLEQDKAARGFYVVNLKNSAPHQVILTSHL